MPFHLGNQNFHAGEILLRPVKMHLWLASLPGPFCK